MKIIIRTATRASVFIAALLITTASAHNKVVVIPLGADANPLGNVITVAKEHGDFTDPITAINSIPVSGVKAPGPSNQYLIVIGPGEYTLPEPLEMREWIGIAGSGPKTTTLTGAVSTSDIFTSGLVSGANNAELSHLKIINSGGGSFSIGVLNSNGNPTMNNLNVFASGGSSANVGILSSSAAPSSMSYITTHGEGGSSSYGLILEGGASPTASYLTATASGGTSNYGVSLFSGSPNMSHVTAASSGGTSSYGIHSSTNSSSPRITNSVLTGGTADLKISSVNTRYINTQLTNGSIENNLPQKQCFGTYDANLNAVDC